MNSAGIKSRITCVSAIVVLVMMMLACGKSHGSSEETWHGISVSQRRSFDSLAELSQRPETAAQLLASVDSLSMRFAISEIHANLLRGACCKTLGKVLSAETYYKKAVDGEIRSDFDFLCYSNAVSMLCNVLVVRGNLEGVMRTAESFFKTCEQRGDAIPICLSGVYGSLGEAQLFAGQIEKADQSYHHSFDIYLNDIPDPDGSKQANALVLVGNYIVSFFRVKAFDIAEPWAHRFDSLLTTYRSQPEVMDAFVDQCEGRLGLFYANIYQGTGRTKEATDAYHRFQNTNYGQSYMGKVDASTYLLMAGRYQEAADNMASLDRCLNDFQITMTLDNIREFLSTKYRVNYYAGRVDTTMAVGLRLINDLDSAAEWQKRDNLAELAILYDMQGKELENVRLTEQMSRYRMSLLLVVILAIVLILTLVLAQQHRSKRRLAQSNRCLMEANERAEAALRVKTSFIKQISHEIRTPLNILSGFAQVLTNPDMEFYEDELKEMNQGITDNANRITQVVDKMLDFSDAMSETRIERNDKVTVQDIAVTAVRDSGIEEAAHLNFQLYMDAAAGDVLLTTNMRYAVRSLTMLLDNACKFTKKAEAYNEQLVADQKESAWLRVSQRDNMIAFVVEDTGIGVPAAEAEHIFEEFVQLDEYYDGTGLGLAVARSLTRHLGGDIILDTTSAYAKGARFIMTLPLDAEQHTD